MLDRVDLLRFDLSQLASRRWAAIEGSPYNAGLFHSGAGFGDDEFFKLYRRVAEAILR